MTASINSHHRRHFLYQSLSGLATTSLVSPLLANELNGAIGAENQAENLPSSRVRNAHITPKAKQVIFLFMLGGPSQLDLFDDKPKLRELDGQPIGDELLSKMKFAQITEKRPSLLGSHVRFGRHGQSGAELSELLPRLANVVDELAI